MPEGIATTRRKLYAEVWTTPMLKLAKRYKISDVGGKKWRERPNFVLRTTLGRRD